MALPLTAQQLYDQFATGQTGLQQSDYDFWNQKLQAAGSDQSGVINQFISGPASAARSSYTSADPDAAAWLAAQNPAVQTPAFSYAPAQYQSGEQPNINQSVGSFTGALGNQNFVMPDGSVWVNTNPGTGEGQDNLYERRTNFQTNTPLFFDTSELSGQSGLVNIQQGQDPFDIGSLSGGAQGWQPTQFQWNEQLPADLGLGAGNLGGTLPPPSTGGFIGGNTSIPSSPFGDVEHNIPIFNNDWQTAPNSGLNWADTVVEGLNQPLSSLYQQMYDAAVSGDYTLTSFGSQLGLNPGEVYGLWEQLVAYAREHNLAIPPFPANTRANAPFANYGFGPAQQLFQRELGGQTMINPIAAYLDQIYAQRESDDEDTVAAAKGGYIGGLTGIQKDPVIKRYITSPMREGGGQEDNINARLSNNEYVFDADSVAALGDGNPDEGARKLDKMRENIRTHKRSAPKTKIPPKAKAPEQYLKGR